MHPRDLRSAMVRFTLPLAASLFILGAIAHLLDPASVAAAMIRVTDAGIESPDGDPAVRVLVFPADQYPLVRAEEAPSTGGGIITQFVLTGSLPEGDTPSAIAFSPDGSKIVVAHRDSRNLIVFDATTHAFLAAIPLSGSPDDVAVSSDGVHAVTANVFENTASIVDLTAGTEVAVVAVGTQPGVVRISPSGNTAVVGNTVESSLSVIDIATATEVRRIAGTGFVATISVSFESGAITAAFSSFEFAGNSKVVHPDFFANRIRIVDVTNGAVTSLVSSNNPRGVAVTPDGTKAVVAHFAAVATVSEVDVVNSMIVDTINIGVDLDGPISINTAGTKAVVAVQNACRVVNLDTHAVSAALSTASVNQLLTTANGLYALAVGFRGSLIDYASETVVKELNNVVSTAIGAVSPAGPRAGMVANTFGEDMLVVNTNGAAGFIEGVLPSGPAPEGDKARTAALSPDGAKAVVASILSDNVSVVDVGSSTVDAIAAAGNRPAEVEITPDGTKAVIANLDSDFVSVMNVATHQVTNVTISTRGSEVEISPDGHYAYIAVVLNDGVWRVDLNTLSVAGPKLVTGNMGGILFLFGQNSGMTLSHDGSTLVTCNSFSNTISIIDTASWSVVATVPVGSFPVRASFLADDSRVMVSNRDSDSISVVANNGPSSVVIGTIAVGDQPFEMAITPDGATLYVANFQAETIGVVDLVGGTMTATIPVPDFPAGLALDPSAAFLYVSTGNWSVSVGPGPAFSIAKSGQFSVIDTATRAIVDQAVTGLPPAQLDWKAPLSLGSVPSPFGDGLTVVEHSVTMAVPAAESSPLLRLAAPSPNPFPGQVTMRYALGRETRVTLAIHDANGRRVATIVDRLEGAGEHFTAWNGRDQSDRRAAPGVYFAQLRAGGDLRVAKLVLIK